MCTAGENGQDEEHIKKPQDAEEAGEVGQEGPTVDRGAGGPYGPLTLPYPPSKHPYPHLLDGHPCINRLPCYYHSPRSSPTTRK